MAVDKPIGFTPDPPPFPEETEQMAQNVVDIQVEEANPNVEMMEDGSAVIGEQESLIPTTFDMNLAEVLDEDLNLLHLGVGHHLFPAGIAGLL